MAKQKTPSRSDTRELEKSTQTVKPRKRKPYIITIIAGFKRERKKR